jgi:two-component system, NarL family, sensor histidine kinase UhpB
LGLGFPQTLEVGAGDASLPRDVEAPDQFQVHVARELHDQVAQPLIELLLQVRELRAAHGDEVIAQELAAVEDSLRQVLRQSREMLIDLRAQGHIRISFPQALRAELMSLPGREPALHVTSRWPRRINGWAAFNLQRIVQQAVANAWQHGRARKVRIFLDVNEAGEAVVAVVDDGIGIQGTTDGFGIVGMRERAAILGGTLSAESKGSGTRVEVRVPRHRLE